MLVSVVIPVRNRPEQVLRAVHSVLEQRGLTRFGIKLEVLVVDDGSTDNTPRVLENILEQRVRLLRHQENLGVSAARNTGLSAAQGEYLALLDSDDWWLPQKLAVHLEYHLTGEWRISQTDEIWLRNGRRVNPMVKHAKPEGRFFAQALKLCLVSPSCVLFDRRFWNEIGPFDAALPACEDYDLWLRTLVHYPVGLCPEKLVCKTGGHSDQLSRKIVGLDLYRMQAMAKLLQAETLSSAQRALTIQELQSKARVYIRGCLLHHKPEEALRITSWLRPWLETKTNLTPNQRQ